MKQCPNCGHPANDGDAFCLMCGTPISSVFTVNKLDASETLEADAGAANESDVSEDSVNAVSEAPEAFEINAANEAEPEAIKPEAQIIDRPAFNDPEPKIPCPVPETKTFPQPLPANNNFTFLNTGAGIVFIVLILAAAVFTVVQNQYIFDLDAALSQFVIYALVSIAVALTVRAKGPDLSIGAVMSTAPAFMAMAFVFGGGSLLLAIILTVAVCALFGLLNGVLITYLKIPAIVLTFLNGVILRGISYLFIFESDFGSDIASFQFSLETPVLLIITAVVFIGAFLFVLFTRLGMPTFKRDESKGKLSCMFAYMSSAVVAAGAGILLLASNLGEAAMVTEPEIFIIFAFSLIIASRAFDNKFAPILLSLVPPVIWVLSQSALILLVAYDQFIIGQYIIGGGLALIMLIIAYACRYEKKDSKYPADNDFSLMQ